MQAPIQKLNIELDEAELLFTRMILADTDEWNRYKFRTSNPASPHREVHDIYARYGKMDSTAVQGNTEAFESVWYLDDQEIRAACEPLANAVYQFVQGESLGGVLITKIPAGKQVYRHRDYGWHATFHSKYCVCIAANEQQMFGFDAGGLRSRTGDVFWFDNSLDHWVTNESSEDRISMIVCVKTPRGIHTP
jgi:Aspartyl/Asparaginyl beta-hydroxylase